jgi:hypothetical protein
MATSTLDPVPEIRTQSSVVRNLFNVLASPVEVFDEVAVTPARWVNWVLPTLLVGFAGALLLPASDAGQSAATLDQLVAAGRLSSARGAQLAGAGTPISFLAIGVGAFAGAFWSAFVLWFIGQVFLKARVDYRKALEVVGLASSILVLGSVVTALLIPITGNALARPALSLLVLNAPGKLHSALDVLNGFHIWSAMVMAVGLSRLSKTTFAESAFWVLGYWIILRLALVLLA